MPVAESDLVSPSGSEAPLTRLPFPPITRSHILHCSFHFWHPLYRSITPKARLIPLSPSFLAYLRADGIVLPSSTPPSPSLDIDDDSGIFISSTSSDTDDDEESPDSSLDWPDVHASIISTIAELDGSVVPKLNWSAPKDATWIAATNSMECQTPNEVYLLLKSSDFITHDLEQAFDGCIEDLEDTSSLHPSSSSSPQHESRDSKDHAIPYYLVLRKTIPALITSLEFRCFVRRRRLLCICQRDLNHYAFLPSLIPTLKSLIQDFFEQKLQNTFPDGNFVFDVYVPQANERGRVWLIDINPWAQRTDPLLFSWLEVLTMPEPISRSQAQRDVNAGVLRLSLEAQSETSSTTESDDETESDGSSESQAGNGEGEPEFRIVKRDDPEAYTFNTPQFSAHKLPKDVVDAGADGEAGLREFMGRWRDIVSRQDREEAEGD
ncbi:hypothetical protein MMC26_004898 [Xylographa opegraphella]|nr:hypothetical protein [Xylographa opegraphella]